MSQNFQASLSQNKGFSLLYFLILQVFAMAKRSFQRKLELFSLCSERFLSKVNPPQNFLIQF